MIDFTDNDFGVVMRPSFDEEDGSWEGDVHVAVFSNLMPDVDNTTHAELMYVAYKMSAMIQLCTENPEVDKAISEFTANMIAELNLPKADDAPKEENKVTGIQGNVITLDFNTKCGGTG